MNKETITNRASAIIGQRFKSANHIQDILRSMLNSTQLKVDQVVTHAKTGLDHELNVAIFDSGAQKKIFTISYILDNGSLLYVTEVNFE